MEKIFIPEKCKVGFQERQGTYTGLLGYVIYNDGKKWRKEPSWESWRHKYISESDFQLKKIESFQSSLESTRQNFTRNIQILEEYKNLEVKPQNNYYKGRTINNYFINYYQKYIGVPFEEYQKDENLYFENYKFSLPGYSTKNVHPVEFDNVPLEGFVINKNVGGYKSGWNFRSSYCRIYDPRGFEFEISFENLMYILENTSSVKGKGLEGKFVYGWQGKDLVLVPENAPEFQEMVEFTQLQKVKTKVSDLVVGNIYRNKQKGLCTYLGFYEDFNYEGVSEGKKHWWLIDGRFKTLPVISVGNKVGFNENIAYHITDLENQLKQKNKNIKLVPYTLEELEEMLRKEGASVQIYIPLKNGSFKIAYFFGGKKYTSRGYSYFWNKSGKQEYITSQEFLDNYKPHKICKIQTK